VSRTRAREEMLSPALARWLVGPSGQSAAADVHTRRLAGEHDLAIGTALRAAGLEPSQATAAMSTVGEQLPLVLTRSAAEQASHPAVSRWRARRFAGAGLVVDLCCGAGLDALAIAARTGPVVAVDRDEARAILAQHNAGARDADVRVVVADALHLPVSTRGAFHADPSRRAGGRRLRRLSDYTPPVDALLDAVRRAAGAAIVVAPGVALDDPILPPDGELEFLQVGDDLVEAVIWRGELRHDRRVATATLLPAGASRHREGEVARLPVRGPGEWLVEVAPAAVRARLHDAIGAEIGAWRLAQRRALLSTASEPPADPWYRRWRIEAVLPARARAVRGWLRHAEEIPLEIATHGMDADPIAFWRALDRPPRGPGGRRIHLVRLDEGARAIVSRPDGPPPARTGQEVRSGDGS
jgi:SAM-dependent methyltransferase